MYTKSLDCIPISLDMPQLEESNRFDINAELPRSGQKKSLAMNYGKIGVVVANTSNSIINRIIESSPHRIVANKTKHKFTILYLHYTQLV